MWYRLIISFATRGMRRRTTKSLGTGFIVRVVTVIVLAILPTDVTIPVLISGIVVDDGYGYGYGLRYR